MNTQLRKISNISSLSPLEIADLIVGASTHEQQIIFEQLPVEIDVKVFEYLPFKFQKSILNSLKPEKTAVILSGMSPDDRTAFFDGLPNLSINALLKLLSTEE